MVVGNLSRIGGFIQVIDVAPPDWVAMDFSILDHLGSTGKITPKVITPHPSIVDDKDHPAFILTIIFGCLVLVGIILYFVLVRQK